MVERVRRVMKGEKSFTLVEVIIAMGILAVVLLEVVSVQLKAVQISDYERNSLQAAWLLRHVMAQVEYKSRTYPLKDMVEERRNGSFGSLAYGENFSYNLTIQPWKLPLVEILVKKILGGAQGEMGDLALQQVKTWVGEDPLKIAHVEVFWPEGDGIKRASVSASLLLTAQSRVDELVASMKLPEEAPRN